jgi:hypothetical protein
LRESPLEYGRAAALPSAERPWQKAVLLVEEPAWK